MMHSVIRKIRLLINFGIGDNERLGTEERKSRIQKFREELSVKKYSDLFSEIEKILLDEKILERNLLIIEFLNLVQCYVQLQERYKELPHLLKLIYDSYVEYRRLNILFENIRDYEFAVPFTFELILLDYFNFLEQPENEYYIHNCFSEIDNFNKMLLKYLSKKDSENRTFEEVINNPELIQTFKNKIDALSKDRG